MKTSEKVKQIADRAAKAVVKRRTGGNGHHDAKDACEAFGVERMLDLVIEGKTRGQVAEIVGASRRSLTNWLVKDETRNRLYREAERARAEWHSEQALSVLEALTPDATNAEVSRAREIASHHRWAAKNADPSRFGDKVEVTNVQKPVSELDDEALREEIDRLLARRNAGMGQRLQ